MEGGLPAGPGTTQNAPPGFQPAAWKTVAEIGRPNPDVASCVTLPRCAVAFAIAPNTVQGQASLGELNDHLVRLDSIRTT